MYSNSTNFEFKSSIESDSNNYICKDRQYLYYNDLQGGNYSANSSEVKFELISLANTNQFVNWSESFLMIPLQLSVSAYTPNVGGALVPGGLQLSPENAFALSLKNGYQQIIDSFLITINDNPVNQPCQASNIEQTIRLYTMSADYRKTLGDMLNFYLDTGDSIRYIPAPGAIPFNTGTGTVNSIDNAGEATLRIFVKGQQFYYLGTLYTIQANSAAAGSTAVQVLPVPLTALGTPQIVQFFTPLSATNQGLGECNNVISKPTGFDPRLGYQALKGVVNEGRRQRMQSTSYDPISLGNPVSAYYQNVASASTEFKNYISQNNTDGVVYNIFATIPMAVLCDFLTSFQSQEGCRFA